MKNTLIALITALSVPSFVDAQEIKLLFGGDVTLGDNYHDIANIGTNVGYSFQKLKPLIDSSDYFVVNLETTVTESTKRNPKLFNFKTPKSDLAILKAGRVNAVSVANNHAYDFGKSGLFDTFDALKEYNIPYVGGGKDYNSARKALRIVIKGKKISFLAFGNNDDESSYTYLLHRREENIKAMIKIEKLVSDVVVVLFHFGVEMDKNPRTEEIALAHQCINSGADVVVGSHPHVVQPVEIYRGKPIAYSLGNFIFGGNRKGPKTGMLLSITILNKKIFFKKIMICVDPVETRYQPYIIENK